MDFLPIRIEGKQAYAGFWIRFGAAIVDALILIPLGFGIFYAQQFDFFLAITLAIVSSFLFSMYNVYFNAVHGGTLAQI